MSYLVVVMCRRAPVLTLNHSTAFFVEKVAKVRSSTSDSPPHYVQSCAVWCSASVLFAAGY